MSQCNEILNHLKRLNDSHVQKALLPIGFKTEAYTVIGHEIGGGRTMYLVRCFCGVEKSVQKGNMLRSKSCGCLTNQIIRDAMTRHGETYTPTWRSWKSMLDRCDNKKHKSYRDYGGRGITYCGSWSVYENFRRDMGARPKGFQLDRIDNNEGYSPSNCRWSTPKQNSNNRRSSVFIEYAGETRTLSQWAERIGMDRSTLWRRLHNGWPVGRALTESVRSSKVAA